MLFVSSLLVAQASRLLHKDVHHLAAPHRDGAHRDLCMHERRQSITVEVGISETQKPRNPMTIAPAGAKQRLCRRAIRGDGQHRSDHYSRTDRTGAKGGGLS